MLETGEECVGKRNRNGNKDNKTCCIICVNRCEARMEDLWECSYTCKFM